MRFLGQCHLVAIALHRLRGWPLVVFYGLRNNKRILIHAGIEDPEGFFWDETGNTKKTSSEYADFLIDNNPPYERFFIYKMAGENLKWMAILKRTGARIKISDYLKVYLIFYSKR